MKILSKESKRLFVPSIKFSSDPSSLMSFPNALHNTYTLGSRTWPGLAWLRCSVVWTALAFKSQRHTAHFLYSNESQMWLKFSYHSFIRRGMGRDDAIFYFYYLRIFERRLDLWMNIRRGSIYHYFDFPELKRFAGLGTYLKIIFFLNCCFSLNYLSLG